MLFYQKFRGGHGERYFDHLHYIAEIKTPITLYLVIHMTKRPALDKRLREILKT